MTDLTQNLVFTDDDVVEDVFRMLEGEVVGIKRGALKLDTGKVLLNEEHGGLGWVAVHMGVNQDVVSDIADGNEPFFTVNFPTPIDLVGTGQAHGRVGACVGLGDGIGITAFALASRDQVLLLLRLSGETHRVGGVPERIPDGAGGLAQLFVEEGLLEDTEALAAVCFAVVRRVEAPFQRGIDDFLVGFATDAVVLFTLHLMREQNLLDEFFGFSL